jgi:hypothetical protein
LRHVALLRAVEFIEQGTGVLVSDANAAAILEVAIRDGYEDPRTRDRVVALTG